MKDRHCVAHLVELILGVIDVHGRLGLRYSVAAMGLTLGAGMPPRAGQAQIVEWARSAGGTSEDRSLGIAVDSAGNSYVTGQFFGMSTFGSFALSSAGSGDIFLAKYDAAGNLIWAQSAGGISNDVGSGIVADAAGNSYVTGGYTGTATFGPFTLTSAGFWDIFVAKYDTTGNVLWARSAGGTSYDEGGIAGPARINR